MSSITPSQVTLNDEERDAFRQLAPALEEFDPVEQAEDFVFNAQLLSAQLPARIRRTRAAVFRQVGQFF